MMRASCLCLIASSASGIKLDTATEADLEGSEGTYSILEDNLQVWQDPSMNTTMNQTLHTGDHVDIAEARALIGGDYAGKVVGRLTNMDENVTGWILLEDPSSGEQAAKRTGPYNHKQQRKERKRQEQANILAFQKKQKEDEQLAREQERENQMKQLLEAEKMAEQQHRDSLAMTKAHWEETYQRTVGWSAFQYQAKPVYDNFDQQEMKSNLDHEAAAAMAQEMLSKMESKEKWSLVYGSHMSESKPDDGYYAGNLDGLPAKGVPALKMAEGSNGFKPTERYADGTTTSFPSMLALASTWSRPMVGKVANAIAEESRAKGANVYLGPSLSVHRSPVGGRNFEQLGGEDPVLGARLAAAFVSTIQKRGVMAAVTNFGFHQQESIAHDANAVVDDRTAWELYYPPFEAAVNAGVGAVVCASNRVNGTDACANRNLLGRDLKGRMNFDGFVMSDRNAHTQSFSAGMDVNMAEKSGPLAKPQPLFAPSDVEGARINTMVQNILTSIYRLRLQEHPGCTLPCTGNLHAVASPAAHHDIARVVAEEAIVLLKNEQTLPITPERGVKSIAIIGGVAWAPKESSYYAGFGSVPAARVALPGEEIAAKAASMGTRVIESRSNDVKAALAAAAQVDVVVIVGGAVTDGADRTHMGLDIGMDFLIDAVAKTGKKVVVLMQTPGAVLMPWKDEVSAIATLFYGGQETGKAWANMLFGEVNPSGKLPVQMPATMFDIMQPNVKYSEGLFTSYRNPSLKAAYPFGHGLSYTHFDFGALEVNRASQGFDINVVVTNVGSMAGMEVVQAYFEFPSLAKTPVGKLYPTKTLRGFLKTKLLQPGESQQVTLHFSARDYVRWDVESSQWHLMPSIKALVGSSIVDIRQQKSFNADAL